MYYVLQAHEPDDPEAPETASFSDMDDSERSWFRGARFDPPPSGPVAVSTAGGVLPDLSEVPVPLLSKRLAVVLAAADVDNLDLYPAAIYDEATGKTHDSHLAFNLIGVVAAADLAASRYSAPEGTLISVDFDGLALDASKARGALLFRLAECITCIVVHETVKRAVEAAGIDTIDFLDPADWIG